MKKDEFNLEERFEKKREEEIEDNVELFKRYVRIASIMGGGWGLILSVPWWPKGIFFGPLIGIILGVLLSVIFVLFPRVPWWNHE